MHTPAHACTRAVTRYFSSARPRHCCVPAIVPPLLCLSCVVMLPTIGSQRILIASCSDFFFSCTRAHIVCQSASRSLFRSRPKISAARARARERGKERTYVLTHAHTRSVKFHAISPFFSSVRPVAISSGHRVFSIQQL